LSLRIVVCVKRVLDPEIPARAFGVDPSGLAPVITGLPAAMVIDSYAENALETGIQLRDNVPGSRLIALCLGDTGCDDVLRRALAFTADDAVRCWDPAWADLDGLAVGHILAQAIRAEGGADVILCGRQAGDIEESVVPGALAEALDATCITAALSVEPASVGLRVGRDADGTLVRVLSSIPAVISVGSSAANVPRMPKTKDAMLARRKAIRTYDADALVIDLERGASGTQLVRLELPVQAGSCTLIGATEPAAQAAELIRHFVSLHLV